LTEIVVEGIAPIYAKSDVSEKLDGLRRCRLLAAHRKGALGQEGLNRFTEALLYRRGVIDPRDTWYDGRPILVTENDYQTGLFNGDQGLVQRTENGMAAVFEEPGGVTRRISTSRLPSVDTVFCMTVHKSQGSEFDTVALFLPEHRSPVVTRELLYTACTRARKRLVLFGTEPVFKKAVETRIQRASGLGDALR
jgi:exodeoxyribonuclease V alpha subunit